MAAEEYTLFPAWARLLSGCAQYCKQSGWRFQAIDFEDDRAPSATTAKAQAVPVVAEFRERLEAADPQLQAQFRHCRRLLADDTVYKMMRMTCSDRKSVV